MPCAFSAAGMHPKCKRLQLRKEQRNQRVSLREGPYPAKASDEKLKQETSLSDYISMTMGVAEPRAANLRLATWICPMIAPLLIVNGWLLCLERLRFTLMARARASTQPNSQFNRTHPGKRTVDVRGGCWQMTLRGLQRKRWA